MSASALVSGALATPTGGGPCELSLVLPCLNEADTLARCIGKAKAALQLAGITGKVIVADNGSSVGSREIAIACGARLVDVARRGYASRCSPATRPSCSPCRRRRRPVAPRSLRATVASSGCSRRGGSNERCWREAWPCSAGWFCFAPPSRNGGTPALGDGDYAQTMRGVLPGATLAFLGIQTIFAGFFALFVNFVRE